MTTRAKIIMDSCHPEKPDARITTFEVYAPRFLLAEVNTHRLIARSAQSSRAVPVKKRIALIEEDPFIPSEFGRNQRGMQAGDEIDDVKAAENVWRDSINEAVRHARQLEALGVHKQLANRIIEPYAYYYGVMTGTEWSWFFQLRNHPDAQPEFKTLAMQMQVAFDASTPVPRKWHTPYVNPFDGDLDKLNAASIEEVEPFLKQSGARSARVSYKTFEGSDPTPEQDMELCERLITSGHLSPFDHVAGVDEIIKHAAHPEIGLKAYNEWSAPEAHRQFWGWIPYRNRIEALCGFEPRRSSWDAWE